MNIFVLNLKRSTDRRKVMQEQMDKHQINFEFIEAIDGKQLTKEQLARVDIKTANRRLGRTMINNEIGCALSHASIYQKMVDEKIKEAIILEDDVILTSGFVKHLKLSTLSNLGYDCLLLYYKYYYIGIIKQIDSFDNYQIHSLNNNPHGAVAYYLNYKMALRLKEITKTISYVADYPIDLNTLGKFGAIQPNMIDTNIEISTINIKLINKWKVRFRIYSTWEYFANRVNYKNLWGYIYYFYSDALCKIFSRFKSLLKL
jgi:glycosyl transferase family 25